MVFIRRLRWNEWNIAHIVRHNVTPTEVEELCLRNYAERKSRQNSIVLVGSTTAGRFLKVVLVHDGDDVYYPLTAHPASRQERRWYASEKGEQAA